MRLRNIPRAEGTIQSHQAAIKRPEDQKGCWKQVDVYKRQLCAFQIFYELVRCSGGDQLFNGNLRVFVKKRFLVVQIKWFLIMIDDNAQAVIDQIHLIPL